MLYTCANGILFRVQGQFAIIACDFGDGDSLTASEAHDHFISGLVYCEAQHIITAYYIGHCGRSENFNRIFHYLLPTFMISANTPAAVTSAPAPGPFTTRGRSL